MPAQIVVVFREPMLAGKTVEALAKAGYNAIAMINSMAALEALEAAETVQLLITSAEFPGGQPNGAALARMTRQRRPGLKVIFADGPELHPYIRQDGAFIPTPTTPGTITELADKMMRGAA